VLLRIGNLRGIDLTIFDFDYDLQWQALMLTADGQVLGRFGGRDADTPQKYQTFPGLRHALNAALVNFQSIKTKRPVTKPIRPEDYPAAAEKRPDNACIHCHHVYEFRREQLQREKKWSVDEVWVYPQPENIGLTLDAEQGDRILNVTPKSAAAALGIAAKDMLRRINNTSIASVADVQYALHKAPKIGEIKLIWNDGKTDRHGIIKASLRRQPGELEGLTDGWRKTDVSWRWSLKSLSPQPGIIGDDLAMDARKSLGLSANQLAYRHMNFLTPAGRYAGLQANDVIVGVNGEALSMNARQFEAHLRLHYRVGQEIELNVLRGKAKLKLKIKLPE
jgi:hypothetical protein